MKRFNISVNGTAYDVCVEEVSAEGAQMAAPAAKPAAPVAKPAAPATPASNNVAGEKITTPMPGTVVDIKVSVGDQVEKNQVVAVLEAMKMENDIVSTCAGTVSTVCVKKGDSVNTNDALVIIG